MALPADDALAGRPVPIGPTVEEWRAMSADERERFVDRVNDALSDPKQAMSEGRPHHNAKARIVDLLGLHFKAMGRAIYVAAELAAVYPGEEAFSPDILAVLDVPQPEEDPRMAWVVADEGRGLDLAFEVLHHGDRRKDLVDNVARYARLGIPEYFVYDRGRQEVHGYRLADAHARRYDRIVPQGGRVTSAVLGLDLAIESDALRFYQGMAELFGTDDLVARLTGMVERLEAKADEAQARADHAQTQVGEARAKAETAAAKAEAAAAKAEEAAASAESTLERMRRGVLGVLHARGVECPDDVTARVLACKDAETLQRWLIVAATTTSATNLG